MGAIRRHWRKIYGRGDWNQDIDKILKNHPNCRDQSPTLSLVLSTSPIRIGLCYFLPFRELYLAGYPILEHRAESGSMTSGTCQEVATWLSSAREDLSHKRPTSPFVHGHRPAVIIFLPSRCLVVEALIDSEVHQIISLWSMKQLPSMLWRPFHPLNLLSLILVENRISEEALR